MAAQERSDSGIKPATKAVHYESAGAYIVSGLIIFGLLGLALDRWSGHTFWTPIGLVVGVLAGGYLVYVRIVREPGGSTPASSGHEGDGR